MSTLLARLARVPCWCRVLPGVLGLFLSSVGPASAEETGGKVIAIEEDWELVLKEPDEETEAPQVTCILAPSNSDNDVFAAFNLNHKSYPAYDAGGLHLQLWDDDRPLGSATFASDALLKTNNEVIRWTSRMRLDDGKLYFEIVSGSSTTWGDFGSAGTLQVSFATEAENLNQYDPQTSVANSGVGYAGNRVASLKLKAVRKAMHSGDVVEDNSLRTVYPHD